MKFTPNLDYNKSWKWKFYFVAVIFPAILKNSDVSAVTNNKSSSKSPSPTVRGNTTVRTNHTPRMRIPNSILSEIRSLDNHLLCFPKLLCTIYQDDSITKRHAKLNVTELGVAYIKLLKAVHYTSPTPPTTTTPATKVKQPIIQIFEIPSGVIKAATYTGRKEHPNSDDLEDYPHHFRSPLLHDNNNADGSADEDDYSWKPRRPLRDDDDDDEDDEEKEFLKEKLEISQMMKELKDEDEAEHAEDGFRNDGLGSTFLNSFLPFMGSRSINKKSFPSTRLRGSSQRKYRSERGRAIKHIQNVGIRKQRHQPDVPQDPFWKAVNLWRSLKSRSQCRQMYKTCPVEAWEIVRMLDLVKGQSQVLSAYLKITVDNVKPKASNLKIH